MGDSSANFNQKVVGQQIIDLFKGALRDLLELRKTAPADQFVDVHYDDVMADPIGQFRRTMELMGLKVGPADEVASTKWMSENERDSHPRHKYKAEDYGVTDAQIREATKFYTDVLVKR